MRTTTLPIVPIAAALTAALALGCTYEVPEYPSQAELYDGQQPRYDPQHRAYPGFVLATPQGNAFVARVHQGGILGYDMHLNRYVNVGRYLDGDDRALRGEAFGQWLDLKVEGGRVHGILDGMIPLDITAAKEGDALRVRGVVRGFQADFRVDDQRLAGDFGRCSYALERRGAIYEGMADCWGQQQLVMVKVPGELAGWTAAEQGAAYGLLLGGR